MSDTPPANYQNTEPNQSRLGSGLKSWWRGLRIGLPGVWLIILYLVFGLLVVFSLSAHQLQYAIKSTSNSDGTPVGLWEVLQVHSEWKALKRVTDTNNRSFENLNKEKEAQQKNQIRIEGDILTIEANCTAEINSFWRYLGEVGLDRPDANNVGRKCEHLNVNQTKQQAQSNMPETEGQPVEFKQHVDAIAVLIDKLNQANVDLSNTNIQLNAIISNISGLQKRIDEGKIEIKKLLDKSQLGISSGDFLNSLSYLEAKETLPFVPSFTEMPADMLTLILVMSMGALGGTINLTRIYLKSKSDDTTVQAGGALYLFRPVLGAITALAIFILAKAGVLIIANPAPGSGAALSPFFVSFLGIISGLLADQALDLIQRTGNAWFNKSGNNGRERWAVGLKEALAKSLNSDDTAASDTVYVEQHQLLSSTLGVSVETLDNWVKQEKPVPWREQSLIAAFVRKPPQLLFSDMPSGMNMTTE